jgi:branched-chain amino acid transport system ATP-binding protein
MLEVQDLAVRYGAVAALRGISLTVDEGEIVAVIGPNGAGKSTLLWSICGAVRPVAGRVTLHGRDLLGKRPEEIVRCGISLVPEDRHVFGSLTVAENLRLGATPRRDAQAVARDLEAMEERFPVLRRYRDTPAGRLSGGEQQQLVITRALMGRPRLLMLDEPSLGLDPQNVARVFEIIGELREQGTTLLLVEQNAAQSVRLADRTYLLRTGEVALHGTREELQDRTDLAEMYLGTAAGAV